MSMGPCPTDSVWRTRTVSGAHGQCLAHTVSVRRTRTLYGAHGQCLAHTDSVCNKNSYTHVCVRTIECVFMCL